MARSPLNSHSEYIQVQETLWSDLPRPRAELSWVLKEFFFSFTATHLTAISEPDEFLRRQGKCQINEMHDGN